MKQRQPSVQPWANDEDEEDSEDDMMEELGVPLVHRYSAANGDDKNVVAPRDKNNRPGPKNEVKSKFKALIDEKKKKQCNYEEVHALYKT